MVAKEFFSAEDYVKLKMYVKKKWLSCYFRSKVKMRVEKDKGADILVYKEVK